MEALTGKIEGDKLKKLVILANGNLAKTFVDSSDGEGITVELETTTPETTATSKEITLTLKKGQVTLSIKMKAVAEETADQIFLTNILGEEGKKIGIDGSSETEGEITLYGGESDKIDSANYSAYIVKIFDSLSYMKDSEDPAKRVNGISGHINHVNNLLEKTYATFDNEIGKDLEFSNLTPLRKEFDVSYTISKTTADGSKKTNLKINHKKPRAQTNIESLLGDAFKTDGIGYTGVKNNDEKYEEWGNGIFGDYQGATPSLIEAKLVTFSLNNTKISKGQEMRPIGSDLIDAIKALDASKDDSTLLQKFLEEMTKVYGNVFSAYDENLWKAVTVSSVSDTETLDPTRADLIVSLSKVINGREYKIIVTFF